MGYAPHTLLTFGGSVGSGADAEIWQCGVRIGMFGGGNYGQLLDLTAYAAAIAGGLKSVWTAPAGFTTGAGWPASWARLEWFKCANIGANGLYSGSTDASGGVNPVTTTVGTPNTGPGTSSAPGFLTLAVSFHTLAPTKYARHGRIYAPLAVGTFTAGGSRVAAGAQTNALSWGQQLLTAISKPANVGLNTGAIRPLVASGHAGELFPITEVRIGDVVDVQRRRKSALRENYAKGAWS